jgi:hypothetical protein
MPPYHYRVIGAKVNEFWKLSRIMLMNFKEKTFSGAQKVGKIATLPTLIPELSILWIGVLTSHLQNI